jgi:hypothetical protein
MFGQGLNNVLLNSEIVWKSKVLVNAFGFTKTCFVSALVGPPKTFLPKLFFFSVTNQNFDQNLYRQSETKIAKTSLTGTKPTYDEIQKNLNKVLVGCKHRHKGHNHRQEFFIPHTPFWYKTWYNRRTFTLFLLSKRFVMRTSKVLYLQFLYVIPLYVRGGKE